ncbi:uncharacterized protein LOC106417000 [Brassica napus]|uniref:uncharacterized protein LOC106417000 n=1 Tax=Brassica napus TaxID=3708 RepID=UPI00207A28BA|nr:uncharacterized protein LOC106417000 [Brassica napus]
MPILGFWRSSKTKGWKFLVDEETGGRLLTLDTSKTFNNLRVMVCEDFRTDVNLVNIELSYLPSDLVIGLDSPPVFITNDRQLKKFLTYVKTKASTRLCVCIRSKVGFDLKEEHAESPNREEVGISCEVSDDIDGEAELEEEDAKIDESDDENKSWETHEYAINVVRGILEKGYEKVLKYLYMMKEANPGSHTFYETESNGRFRFLFISHGQSICGFYAAIRKIIVVDGTFLKSKYKGVLLVATALDGNSNLYPIAFGVVDSENDRLWEWFMRQLNVVIADDQSLASVSDRNTSLSKALAKVYPHSHHGICIHHLLNNVVTYFKGKGVAGLVAKAFKASRVADFKKQFTVIFSISPAIGNYLIQADVKKWARCQFSGYKYDVRTNNPAESINSTLRLPREFPVIPLLDIIREMMTRWFFKRRTLSSKHKQPLTVAVEKKIDRRIEKGKKFQVFW